MKVVVAHLHGDNESTYDVQDRLGLSDDQREHLKNALYEVEFEVDVDTGEILSVDGKKLAGESS